MKVLTIENDVKKTDGLQVAPTNQQEDLIQALKREMDYFLLREIGHFVPLTQRHKVKRLIQVNVEEPVGEDNSNSAPGEFRECQNKAIYDEPEGVEDNSIIPSEIREYQTTINQNESPGYKIIIPCLEHATSDKMWYLPETEEKSLAINQRAERPRKRPAAKSIIRKRTKKPRSRENLTSDDIVYYSEIV